MPFYILYDTAKKDFDTLNGVMALYIILAHF